MNKFEDFINAMSPKTVEHLVPTIDVNVTIDPETLAKMRAAINDAVQRQTATAFGVIHTDNSKASASLDKVAFEATVSEMRRCHTEYLRQREADMIRMRERWLQTDTGAALVGRIDRFAATNGIDWIDAANIVVVADCRDVAIKAFEHMEGFLTSPGMQAAFRALVGAAGDVFERIGDPFGDMIGDDEPVNRHQRRARHHSKRLQDGDQKWKRTNRDFRNRR